MADDSDQLHLDLARCDLLYGSFLIKTENSTSSTSCILSGWLRLLFMDKTGVCQP